MVATLGIVLIVALPLSNNVGRLVGYYLTQASPTPFVCILALISSNVAGYTKKTTVAALYLIGYAVGNIIGLFSRLLHDIRHTYIIVTGRSKKPLMAVAFCVQAHRHSDPKMPPGISLRKSPL